MANKSQKRKREQDRKAKIKGNLTIAATIHGSRGGKAFLSPDNSGEALYSNMKPRSWKRTRRHPANIAIGNR